MDREIHGGPNGSKFDFRGANTNSIPGFNREVERSVDREVGILCTLEDVVAYLQVGDRVKVPATGDLADLCLSPKCNDVIRGWIFEKFPAVHEMVVEREAVRILENLREELSERFISD